MLARSRFPVLNVTTTPPTSEAAASDDATVGARLKEAREERGFSQGAVANRTKMQDPEGKGISRTSLIGYEQGSSRPGLREIRLLCQVLLISPNWLIFGTESAADVTQPSREFFRGFGRRDLENIAKTSLALIALKGHERDALLNLALSLAGRQLGDARLAALLMMGQLVGDRLLQEVRVFVPEATEDTSLESIADSISRQAGTNQGTRLRIDVDEAKVVGGIWTYPDPSEAGQVPTER